MHSSAPGAVCQHLLIPEYSGINKGQRIHDRSKAARRKPPVKCFLTQDVKDLDSENDKILTEIEEDANKCKDVLCSWTKRISTVKLSILHTTISKNPYQNSNGIFIEVEWNKICME